MKMAICVMAACGAVAVAGLITLANEIGRFCEDINPYKRISPDEIKKRPVKTDCYGCMGAAFGDCEQCEAKRKE